MLESINLFLTERFGEFGTLLIVGILGLFMILLTLPILLRKQEDPLDKLRDQARGRTSPSPEDSKQQLRSGGKKDKLEKYSTFLEPKDEKEYSAVRLKLMQAGYRSKNAVRTFHFMQFALGIGFLILGAIYAILKSSTGAPGPAMLILYVLGPGVVGYMLPKYWVTKRQQERQQEITNGFPDSLDLMLVCVEAGQSIDQAIVRVSKEVRPGYPSLADEYEMVSHEMKAGKDKTQVLRDMSERAGVTDVSSFVTVLIQSTTFGTSISDALRVYAEEMRDKRVMRAEEAANKLPTKMTLATMMLTVPPLLIILIGPSIYEIAQTLNAATFF